MDTLKNCDGPADIAASPEPAITPQDAGRQRLHAALTAAEGLWKDRKDIPKDGVEYQGQLRAEWR
ncbi:MULTISPECIES: hypothetical protein [unclassified Janthinobacterium]|uniref:hypothetical protein n=1 Tax=unclassified Janthinobacterium TaxID=2610881 RepID=UPI00037A6C3C|nr:MULTISPECIES: hypothetical protein [unclassified Janthinobacterium]MEC5160050.1 hypothetical protein [Janthinobacterium sp. CG_S6]